MSYPEEGPDKGRGTSLVILSDNLQESTKVSNRRVDNPSCGPEGTEARLHYNCHAAQPLSSTPALPRLASTGENTEEEPLLKKVTIAFSPPLPGPPCWEWRKLNTEEEFGLDILFLYWTELQFFNH